jgi:hypothetical protein
MQDRGEYFDILFLEHTCQCVRPLGGCERIGTQVGWGSSHNTVGVAVVVGNTTDVGVVISVGADIVSRSVAAVKAALAPRGTAAMSIQHTRATNGRFMAPSCARIARIDGEDADPKRFHFQGYRLGKAHKGRLAAPIGSAIRDWQLGGATGNVHDPPMLTGDHCRQDRTRTEEGPPAG